MNEMSSTGFLWVKGTQVKDTQQVFCGKGNFYRSALDRKLLKGFLWA